MTAVGMPSGYFADNPSKAVSRKVSVPTEQEDTGRTKLFDGKEGEAFGSLR